MCRRGLEWAGDVAEGIGRVVEIDSRLLAGEVLGSVVGLLGASRAAYFG